MQNWVSNALCSLSTIKMYRIIVRSAGQIRGMTIHIISDNMHQMIKTLNVSIHFIYSTFNLLEKKRKKRPNQADKYKLCI